MLAWGMMRRTRPAARLQLWASCCPCPTLASWKPRWVVGVVGPDFVRRVEKKNAAAHVMCGAYEICVPPNLYRHSSFLVTQPWTSGRWAMLSTCESSARYYECVGRMASHVCQYITWESSAVRFFTANYQSGHTILECRYELHIQTMQLLAWYGGPKVITPEEYFAADLA